MLRAFRKSGESSTTTARTTLASPDDCDEPLSIVNLRRSIPLLLGGLGLDLEARQTVLI
jgi:hypothetical protein